MHHSFDKSIFKRPITCAWLNIDCVGRRERLSRQQCPIIFLPSSSVTARPPTATDPPAEDTHRATIAIGDIGLSRDAAAGASHPGEGHRSPSDTLERPVDVVGLTGFKSPRAKASINELNGQVVKAISGWQICPILVSFVSTT